MSFGDEFIAFANTPQGSTNPLQSEWSDSGRLILPR
jgi:hypothetical protein